MNIRIDVYHHFHDEAALNNKLDLILQKVAGIEKKEVHMSQEMDALKVVVSNTKAGIDSAIVFIQGIIPQITDAAGDKAASLALAAELTAKTADLATAMANPGELPAPPA
jgi:hypothetical protein